MQSASSVQACRTRPKNPLDIVPTPHSRFPSSWFAISPYSAFSLGRREERNREPVASKACGSKSVIIEGTQRMDRKFIEDDCGTNRDLAAPLVKRIGSTN